MTVQAQRYRVSEGAELARLVIHGALHLCGHDHMKAGERKRMRAREEAALALATAQVRAFDAVLVRAAGAAAKAAAPPAAKPRRKAAAASPERARPARSRAKSRLLHRTRRSG
ncbi:MAG: rRNA maturation RNase YbeY [Candidatus Eisenbacteria bacterium]|nr:rRNA maturation RNase YbeY [Candidatus Eisenbacteria bacterium]